MNKDSIFVGTINFDETINEIGIGLLSLKSLGECNIYVYANEGTIPHFHIISRSENFECCICIYEPLYFDHGYKAGKLNAKQRKQMNNWLKKKYNTLQKETNWEMIKLYWKANNPSNNKYNIQETNTQPDYTNMENYKTVY